MKRWASAVATAVCTVALAVTGCAQWTPDGNIPASPDAGRAADSDLLAELVALTDSSSPGATKNYFWVNGPAQLDQATMPKTGTVSFTADARGRSGVAKASLTYQMFADSRGERQGDPLDPPGWPKKNPKIAITYTLTGKTYHGYAWNRSHSIADSLVGEQSYTSKNNFTAGTRTQNVGADQHGGMRAAEEAAENYWKNNPGSKVALWYQTTPLYAGNEKIPRGSVVDERSSDGSLNTQFVIVNDAEGWTINYKTGAMTSVGGIRL